MPFQSEIFTCQRVLGITVFFGFIVHHMLRVNISLAIVEMITRNNSNITEEDHGPRYYWNEEEKNDILGIFYWGYILTQIPGGRLSEKFGTKIILAIGILAASVSTLSTPLAAYYSYRWLAFTRFCLGFALGVHWPSTHPIGTKWIAPEDMSTFTSHMTASSLGVAITLPVSAYLIANWGWPIVFYVTGSVGLVWTLAWCYLIYDTPEKHPRISAKEKEKLTKLNNVDLGNENTVIPWRQLLTSGPVWSIVIGNGSSCFTFFLAFNQLPTYMNQVHQLNITANGLISSLPYVVRYTTSVCSAIAADKIIKSKKFSKTAVRKFFNVSFFLGTSLLFTIQAIWGYNTTVTLIVFTGSFALMGFLTGGFFSNAVDIAPAYSGTIFGIGQIFTSIAGYMTTKVVGLVTKDEQSFEQWAYVFWMLVGVNLFATIISYIFTSGEEQSWSSRREDKELETLEGHRKENS